MKIRAEMAETKWKELEELAHRLTLILKDCKKNQPQIYFSERITCNSCPQKDECQSLKKAYNKLSKKLEKRELVTPLELENEGFSKGFKLW